MGWLRKKPDPVPDAVWDQACASVPWAHSLTDTAKLDLRVLSTHFLHEKTITPLAGLSLDAVQRTQLAILCCLPLLRYGRNGLAGWSQLLVYPEAFRVQRSHVDAAGILHEWDDELIGEAWEHGPLVLSWADVQADLDDPHAGYCVAIHEMAHKLDALDGVMDGTPLLPHDWQREWAHDFQQAYDAFCRHIDAGEDSDIDPYAAESPEEFFAVLSEYHFSAPERLQAQMPRVAAHLQRFYAPR